MNIGCGRDIRHDCMNFDVRPMVGIDVVGDIRNLPFKDRSIQNCFCIDVLEHLPRAEFFGAIDQLCQITGGFIHIKTLAIDHIIHLYNSGQKDIDSIITLLYGGQDYPENFHGCAYPSWLIVAQVCQNGFRLIDVEFDDIGNINVHARRD